MEGRKEGRRKNKSQYQPLRAGVAVVRQYYPSVINDIQRGALTRTRRGWGCSPMNSMCSFGFQAAMQQSSAEISLIKPCKPSDKVKSRNSLINPRKPSDLAKS